MGDPVNVSELLGRALDGTLLLITGSKTQLGVITQSSSTKYSTPVRELLGFIGQGITKLTSRLSVSEQLGSISDPSKLGRYRTEPLGSVNDSAKLTLVLQGNEHLGLIVDSRQGPVIKVYELLQPLFDNSKVKTSRGVSDALSQLNEQSGVRFQIGATDTLSSVSDSSHLDIDSHHTGEVVQPLQDLSAVKAQVPVTEPLGSVNDFSSSKRGQLDSLGSVSDVSKVGINRSDSLLPLVEHALVKSVFHTIDQLHLVQDSSKVRARFNLGDTLNAALDSSFLRRTIPTGESLSAVNDSSQTSARHTRKNLLFSVFDNSNVRVIIGVGETLGSVGDGSLVEDRKVGSEVLGIVADHGQINFYRVQTLEHLGLIGQGITKLTVKQPATDTLGSINDVSRVDYNHGLPPTLPSGSNAITPWIPDLTLAYLDNGYVEEWTSPSLNFRCVINCRTVSEGSYVDSSLGTIPPMRGAFSGGPSGPAPVSFILDFENPILSTGHFTSIDQSKYADYWVENKHNVQGGAGEHRSFTWPPLRWVLNNPDPNEQAKGWNAIVSKLTSIITNRPNGFIWAPFQPPKVKVGSFDINVGKATGAWNSTQVDAEGYNYWDRGHNESGPDYAGCAVGHPMAFITLWQKWKWVIQAYNPLQTGPFAIYHLDQPRSTMWICLLMIRAWLAGFEWADPLMVSTHVGGFWLGLNSGNGLKPSTVLNAYMKLIIGDRFKPSGNMETWGQQGGTMIDTAINGHCDDQGGIGCLCSAVLDVNGNWIGPDGVNYGNQCIGADIWQGGMMGFGIIRVRQFHDYMLQNFGFTVLEPDVVTGLDSLIAWHLDQNKQSGWFASDGSAPEQKRGNWAYTSGVGRHNATPDFGPTGYPSFTVVDKMATDMQNVCGKYPFVNYQRYQRPDGSWILREGDTGFTAPVLAIPAPAIWYGVGVEEVTTTWGIWTPPPSDSRYVEWQKYLDILYAIQEGGNERQDRFTLEQLGSPADLSNIGLHRSDALSGVLDSSSLHATRRVGLSVGVTQPILDSARVDKNNAQQFNVSEFLGGVVDISALLRHDKYGTEILSPITDSANVSPIKLQLSEILNSVDDKSRLDANNASRISVFETLGAAIDTSQLVRSDKYGNELLGSVVDSSKVLSVRFQLSEILGALFDSSLVVQHNASQVSVSESLGELTDLSQLVRSDKYGTETLAAVADTVLITAINVRRSEILAAVGDLASVNIIDGPQLIFVKEQLGILADYSDVLLRGTILQVTEALGKIVDGSGSQKKEQHGQSKPHIHELRSPNFRKH